MSVVVSLPCPACGREPARPWTGGAPQWAAAAGTAEAQWPDSQLPPVGRWTYEPRAWDRQLPLRPVAGDPPSTAGASDGLFLAERSPRPGEERAVRVRGPLLIDGGTFWALFEPALASLEWIFEHPRLLRDCTLVACTPLEILAQRGGQAWLRVRIEDVIGVVEAADRYPPTTAGTLGFLLPSASADTSLYHAASDQFSYYAWDVQGNFGRWAICTEGEAGIAVVMLGDWSSDISDVAIGHRRLTAAETATFRERFAGAQRLPSAPTSTTNGAPTSTTDSPPGTRTESPA